MSTSVSKKRGRPQEQDDPEARPGQRHKITPDAGRPVGAPARKTAKEEAKKKGKDDAEKGAALNPALIRTTTGKVSAKRPLSPNNNIGKLNIANSC